MKSAFLGKYTIKLIGGDGNIKFESTFTNTITDYGLQALVEREDRFRFSSIFQYAMLGTTTGVPSDPTNEFVEGRSELSTPAVNVEAEFVREPVMYKRCVLSYEFGPGVAAGTWGEIGISDSNSHYQALSKVSIKDDNGEYTTIEKIDEDTLQVHYEIRQYIPDATVGSFVMDGVSYQFTAVPYGAHPTTTNWVSQGFSAWGTPTHLSNPVSLVRAGSANFYDSHPMITFDEQLDVNTGDNQPKYNEAMAYSLLTDEPSVDITITLPIEREPSDSGISMIGLNHRTDQVEIPSGSNLYNGEYSGYAISFDPPLPKGLNTGFRLTFRWSFERA